MFDISHIVVVLCVVRNRPVIYYRDVSNGFWYEKRSQCALAVSSDSLGDRLDLNCYEGM